MNTTMPDLQRGPNKPTTLASCLVNDWAQWLNNLFHESNLPYKARPSPIDAGNEYDPSVTKGALLITSSDDSGIAVMIGLISLAMPGDNDEDADILAQEVQAEQIVPLQQTGPFYCFVAHGTSALTAYVCGSVQPAIDVHCRELLECEGGGVFRRADEVSLRRMLLDQLAVNNARITKGGTLRVSRKGKSW